MREKCLIAQSRQRLIRRLDYIPPCIPYTVDADERPLHSWRVLILPYLSQQDDLYKQIRLDEPWDSEYNKQFHSQMPLVFQCRGIERYHNLQDYRKECRCCYSVVVGKETPFPGSETTALKNISDTENTILVVERMSPINWMNPMGDIPVETASCGINAEPTGIGSGHSGGCNCAIADGSARFIRDTSDSQTLKTMFSRNGKSSE